MKEVSQRRPWVRFWARNVDYSVFGLIGITIVTIVNPEISKIPANQLNTSLSFIVPFVWIFVESFLLFTWGTTPGKWLLKISVRTTNGQKLNYSAAFKRSVNVWMRGLILGFPLLCIIGEVIAYNEVLHKGITSWDKKGGFIVSHERIDLWRIIVTILFFAILLLLICLGKTTGK